MWVSVKLFFPPFFFCRAEQNLNIAGVKQQNAQTVDLIICRIAPNLHFSGSWLCFLAAYSSHSLNDLHLLFLPTFVGLPFIV
jgi:hypothetical protein